MSNDSNDRPIIDVRFDRVILALAERGYAPTSNVALRYQRSSFVRHISPLSDEIRAIEDMYDDWTPHPWGVWAMGRLPIRARTFCGLLHAITRLPLAKQPTHNGWVSFDPATMRVSEMGAWERV